MAYTIAIAGKGGTGKSTIAGIIIRLIKEKKLGSVLGIDADPNSNLAEFLGEKTDQTIGTVLDGLAGHPDSIPSGMTNDRYLEYQVQTIVRECEGFDLLTMGRPEGPGCYCYVNNVLRNVMAKFTKDYDYVVIDNEAGLEHFSRKTTGQADVLLVVSDATVAGLRAAKRIRELIGELKIKTNKKFLIINDYEKKIEKERLDPVGLDLIGQLPKDEQVSGLSSKGESLFKLKKNSSFYESLDQIIDNIID
jgi:CO dehydrogenase maturation factor